jgi:hypothetical protein
MFMLMRYGICCVPAIFERRRGRLGSKISGCGQLAEAAVYVALAGLPRKQTPGGSVGTSAACCQKRKRANFTQSFCSLRDYPPITATEPLRDMRGAGSISHPHALSTSQIGHHRK